MSQQTTNILTEMYYIKHAHYGTSVNNLNSLTRIYSRTVRSDIPSFYGTKLLLHTPRLRSSVP